MRRVSTLLVLAASLTFPACSGETKPSAEEFAKPQTEAIGKTEAASDEPRVYQSPDGRFHVRFPGEPRVSQRPASSKAESGEVDTYTLIRLPRSFIVERSHLAEPGDPQKEISRMIAESQGSGVKVLESKDVTLKGRPGKDTLCATDDERLSRERFFVDGKDLYHLISIVPHTDEDTRAAADFVESFEFLKD